MLNGRDSELPSCELERFHGPPWFDRGHLFRLVVGLRPGDSGAFLRETRTRLAPCPTRREVGCRASLGCVADPRETHQPDSLEEVVAAHAADLVEAGLQLAAQRNLDSLLRRIALAAREVLGARYAALGVLDDAGTGLSQFVTSGIDDETAHRIGPPPKGRGLLGAVISERRAVRLEQIGSDPRSVGFPLGHPDMTTFLGVPIVLGEEVFGNLYVTDKLAGPFTEVDEQLVSVLAAQAAVAIDNARSFEEERRRADEKERALAEAVADGYRRAIRAQEAERTRIARELHDEAGQVVSGLALHLRAIEECETDPELRERLSEARLSLTSASRSLRDLIVDLRPRNLREQGLEAAIGAQAERVRRANGAEVEIAVAPIPELSEEIEVAVFRVVQEALTNVARHSDASRVSVFVGGERGRLRVVVEDNGVGFDPEAPTRRLGLMGIRERVTILGGTVTIDSSPGQGTAVTVEIATQGASGEMGGVR